MIFNLFSKPGIFSHRWLILAFSLGLVASCNSPVGGQCEYTSFGEPGLGYEEGDNRFLATAGGRHFAWSDISADDSFQKGRIYKLSGEAIVSGSCTPYHSLKASATDYLLLSPDDPITQSFLKLSGVVGNNSSSGITVKCELSDVLSTLSVKPTDDTGLVCGKNSNSTDTIRVIQIPLPTTI